MENHLKEAVLAYKLKESDIAPISQMDAEIIYELRIICGKIKQDELKQIIDEWKHIPDDEVLNFLLQWNLDHPEIIEKEAPKDKDFILLSELSLDIKFLCSVGKKERFDYQKGKNFYSIVINEFVSEHTPYYNLEVKYENKAERDKEFDNLHVNLSNKINFI